MVSIAKSEKRKNLKLPILYRWFLVCSKKSIKLIRKLYFKYGLWPDLAESS
jgi:hypothetical protein